MQNMYCVAHYFANPKLRTGLLALTRSDNGFSTAASSSSSTTVLVVNACQDAISDNLSHMNQTQDKTLTPEMCCRGEEHVWYLADTNVS